MIVLNCFALAAQTSGIKRSLLAPGKISTDRVEYGSSVSVDGKEIYFVRSKEPWGSSKSSGTIYYSRMTEGAWSDPEIVSFSGQYDDSDPHLSADGRQLYFVSRGRENVNNSSSDIWTVQRNIEGDWGTPEKLEQPINSNQREWSPRTDSEGNLYFASDRSGGSGQGDLYISKMVGGKLQPPENLGKTINLPTGEWNLDISGEGKVLIFEASGRTENKSPYGDLYISFKKGDKWSVPQNLIEVNTSGSDLYPQFIEESGLLFYSSSDSLQSKNSCIYMVSLTELLCSYRQRATFQK